jgi:hypothetical protein
VKIEPRRVLATLHLSLWAKIMIFFVGNPYIFAENAQNDLILLGQPAAQTEISAAQSLIENQRFFDILGVYSLFFVIMQPKKSIFFVAAQRPIWVGHPCARFYNI